METKGLLSSKPAYSIICIFLLVGLIVSIIVAIAFGTVQIPVEEVYTVVLYQVFGIGDPSIASTTIHDVVWLIRFPRVLLAAVVGMALSVSGLVMQAVVRNPLAEPYVLGVSSGAYLGVVLAIMLGIGSFVGGNFVGVMACVGAFAVSMAVMWFASLGGRATSVKLVLMGFVVSAICQAFANFFIFNTADTSKSQTIINWTMGSLGGAEWGTAIVVAPFIVVCTLLFWAQYRNLNLMLLGDETAIRLGTNLERYRLAYLLTNALLVGFAVYAAGMVGFVGLVIPHAMRILFGTNHKRLVPLCALSGAIFLIWADVLCRVIIAGAELPIGILTAMIGAPVFVYLMISKRYSFGSGD